MYIAHKREHRSSRAFRLICPRLTVHSVTHLLLVSFKTSKAQQRHFSFCCLYRAGLSLT